MDVRRYPTDGDFARLLAGPAKVISTAAGPVEYAEAGEGPALLSVHGSFGGWDYALGMAAVFALNGFRVIAPSRPGYLGTPVATGRTYEQQADALVALLDGLGIERTAAIAHSGGGPPTYLLAARHPSRTAALVEVGAVSTRMPMMSRGAAGMAASVTTNRAVGVVMTGLLRLTGLLTSRFPVAGIRYAVLPGEVSRDRPAVGELAQRIAADPQRMAFVSRVWVGTSANRAGERLPGYRNDVTLLKGLRELPLGDITCPVLVVVGTADPYREPAEFAAKQIHGAELHRIDDGSHRGLWVDDDWAEQQSYVLAWLRQHT
jgi:pimeloyl-ACP methyl ester carboxylesterase